MPAALEELLKAKRQALTYHAKFITREAIQLGMGNLSVTSHEKLTMDLVLQGNRDLHSFSWRAFIN